MADSYPWKFDVLVTNIQSQEAKFQGQISKGQLSDR